MSDINVTVTNAGATKVDVSNGAAFNATVGTGGNVKVSVGTISPGDATIVSGTVAIGKTATLAAGSAATVANVGTPYAAVLDFGIPVGKAGADGVTPTISVGKVSTLSAGSSATVSSSQSGGTVTLDFGIPQGEPGETGGGGADLSDDSPEPLGAASAGVSLEASRSDHVHELPTAEALGLATVATTGSYADLSGAPDGVSLSDATPEPLGVAVPGNASAASRADHVHPVPSAADIGALDADSVIDGGDYVGVIVSGGSGSVQITAQPQNRTVSLSAAQETTASLPSGSWLQLSYADSSWYLTPANGSTFAASADGISWTTRTGLPAVGAWRRIQYQDGVYATQTGNTIATSSDAETWAGATYANSAGALFGAGGVWLRGTTGGVFSSTDATNWTQRLTLAGSSTSKYFTYAGGVYLLVDWTAGLYGSANGTTWTSLAAMTFSGSVVDHQQAAVSFGSDVFFVPNNKAFLYRINAAATTAAVVSLPNNNGTIRQVATDGTTLVVYRSYGSTNAAELWSSTDGATWTLRLSATIAGGGAGGRLYYAADRFVFVDAYDQVSRYWTSTSGTTWTEAARTYSSAAANTSWIESGVYGSHVGGAFATLAVGASSGVASFQVSAYLAGGTLSYQWERSTDSGTTWAALSGETAATLSLAGLTTGENGYRYRCVVSASGATPATSNAATLTVTS